MQVAPNVWWDRTRFLAVAVAAALSAIVFPKYLPSIVAWLIVIHTGLGVWDFSRRTPPESSIPLYAGARDPSLSVLQAKASMV